MKVSLITLGCKLNQFESSAIQTQLLKYGFNFTDNVEESDIVILNTCTVTNTADTKVVKIIRKINKVKSIKDSLLIVTGCYAQTDKEKLINIPGVNLIVDNNKKYLIPEIVKDYRDTGLLKVKNEQNPKGRFEFVPEQFLGRTRAFLKIQDGCDRMCTFCKVPFARGRSVSLDREEVERRFKKLISLGYKEIVITGVNITSYYHNGNTLKDLVKGLCSYRGDFRIRLSSIMPDEFDEEILDIMRDGKIASHLHISLQSGSDYIIKLMRRNYTSKDLIKLSDKARKLVPDIGFTGDVIVGFPGETDKEFEETKQTIREVGFFRLHIFPFSPRKGTPAAYMPFQVSEEIKKQREKELQEVLKELSVKYKSRFINREIRMLPEELEGDKVYGYADNYLKVISYNTNLERNKFYEVKVVDINSEDITSVVAE